ncbi:MAG: CpaD family pilus assembly lipoprotein [Sphingobium sp.]
MTHMTLQKVLRLSAVAALVLPVASLAVAKPSNRGMQSIHQPVVSYASFIYDVQGSATGALTQAENIRLTGWLDSLNVGYGDHLAIATDEAYVAPKLREGIADALGHRGMLVEEDASAAAGKAPYGYVRLILRRATASVPGCPDWSGKAESNMSNGVSANYGCAVNGNIAAMVANPEDLVRGQTGSSDLRTATSNLAIKTYRDKAPTGSGDLKSLGGN